MRSRLSPEFIIPVIALTAIAFPFLVVRFVPSTDLPQHLAQIRLFVETIRGEHTGVLTIQWFSPNTLIYLLLGLMWALFPPVLAGKMAMLVLAIIWSGSAFILGRVFQRSLESAAMSSLLVFSGSFYWGYLSFLSGWPIFAIFLCLSRRLHSEGHRVGTLILFGIAATTLFFAHALWLIVGIAAVALFDLLDRVPLRLIARQAVALAPVLLFALIWYPHFSASREAFEFDTAARWGILPWERLTPSWLTSAALGGLRGPWDAMAASAISIWAALVVITCRGNLRSLWDRKLGYLGILVLVLALVAPDKYLNTISFASRWIPVAIALLLLSLPAPKMPRLLVVLYPLTLVVSYSLVTAFFWVQFEQVELSGLSDALDSIPANSRTLGLDFIKESKYLTGRPFLQTFAYAQVVHGGDLNFSFVRHGAGIVAAISPPVYTWTPDLEWFPEKVDKRDFRQFDAALINGTEEMHRALQTFGVAVPITNTGRWRAYLCVGGSRTPK